MADPPPRTTVASRAGEPVLLRHRAIQLGELRRRYEVLTKRITALDTDIGRELDSERKLVLQERRADLVVEHERDQNVVEIQRLENEIASHNAAIAETVYEDASQAEKQATTRTTSIGTTVPSIQQPSKNTSLAWLQGRVDMQLREGRISASDQETLHTIYRLALSKDENPEAPENAESPFPLYDIDEGEAMAAQNTNTVSLAESVFTRTSHSLARNLAEVVQHHAEWPELIVGDEVTDRTIQALKNMQSRIEAADKLAAKYIAPSAQRRFQMERNGMVNSASELVGVFDELSGHLGGGKVPWSIVQQMEQLLDDLTYYTNRCLLWLTDLARSAHPAESLQ